jgi:hypothetical protein
MISSKRNKTYKAPYKGVFRPTNPKKYVGDSRKIIYRSSWEKKFMKHCDTNPEIIEWASEEMFVHYVSPIDKKIHRYFPDFLVKTSNGKKIMIEIKPAIQCKPPRPRSRKTKRYVKEQFAFIKNISKWKAAKEYCSNNGIEFKIFTEKELNIN